MSSSLIPHGLQHIRLLCLSLAPGVCSDSCPLSWWCYLTISFSAAPFFSCLQFFPESGSFPMSQLFILGGQSIGASGLASVLPVSIQGWSPLGLTGLILHSKGPSGVFSSITIQKHQLSPHIKKNLPPLKNSVHLSSGSAAPLDPTATILDQVFISRLDNYSYLLPTLLVLHIPSHQPLKLPWVLTSKNKP